jgi:TolB-like protein
VLFVIFAAAASWAFWKGGPDEAPSVVWERSVAVLPFTHLGADDSTDYFSLGITEELLTRLARVSDLSVISRTSVMRYQDTHKSLREIGDELGVATIVEGSVQQVGDRVRIHAQLIDAETDRHLWGESYDRRLEDILAVQSEVAIHIAEALQAELLPNEQTQLTSRRDVDEAAYHLYLRALHLQDRREPAGIVKATQLLQDAIRQDSTFGPAYGSLALAYVWSGLVARMSSQAVDVTGMPPETAIPQALQTADRALALDSSVVEAHLARALAYNIFTREWEKSEQAFQRALAINPNHSETIQEYGRMLLRLGHVERALVQMRRAVALDPLSGTARMGLGYTYHCLRRYEDAIRELETALDLDNASPFTPKYLAHAHLKRAEELAQQGRTQEADARLQRAEEAMEMSWGPDSTRQRLFEYAVKGVSEEVLKILDGGNVSYGLHLWALLLADQRDAALDHINHNFTWGVFADPLFDPVRDDPRFEAIVEAKLERDVDLR